MENQRKVWNNIAKEWHKFKQNPSIEAIEFLKKQKGNVLDLGSGSGRHLINIKKGKMFLVDFSFEMINLAKTKAKKLNIETEFFVSEIDKIPFQDNLFDCAISIAAIHCLETQKKRENSIKELYRVLKPKALALIAVWNKDSPRFKKKNKNTFVNWRDKGERFYYLFEEKEIHDLFKKSGFKIIKKIPHSANIMFIAKKI